MAFASVGYVFLHADHCKVNGRLTVCEMAGGDAAIIDG